VALTANAIRGDRQLCLEAGMDEYLSKPFEARSLVEMIDRVLDGVDAVRGEVQADIRKHPAGAVPVSDSRPAADDPPLANGSPPPIDANALTARCMGSVAFAASLLDELANTGEQRVEEIARQAAAGDAAATAAAAHSLKGAAGIVTAEAVRSLAAEIEVAGNAGDLAAIAKQIEELRREMRQCLAFIPTIWQQNAEPVRTDV
jgi:CheY-like chemotaxis protein